MMDMRNVQISTATILVMLKKETVDHLRLYLQSQGEAFTTTTYDDIIQEWVNWQKKAAQEEHS